ncbi:MAG: hypothetical protein AB7F78_24465 [Hyphomicrobiaceae bacterium]
MQRKPSPDVSSPAGRRRMLGMAAGTAAVVAAGPVAATEAEPIEALWRDYLQACKRYTDACEAEWDATDAAREQCPPRPASLYARDYHTGELTPLYEDTLIRWRDTAKGSGFGSHEDLDKRLATLKAWEAACAAVDQAHGVDALSERAEELGAAMDALAERIIETPAQTMRAALVKLKLAVKLRGIVEDDDEDGGAGRVIRCLIADIEAGGAK